VVLCSGDTIQREHLPDYITGQESTKVVSFPIGTTLQEIEDVMIARTLEATGGSKEEAARLLGIGVATLYRKLKDHSESATQD
jgi:transcriptional regulator of acetoin/glycerol metabolism